MIAQTRLDAVRFVEVAFRQIHSKSQEELAEQMGFLCHSPVSRAQARVQEGKADSLLASYNGKAVLMAALSNGIFGDALRAALNSAKPPMVSGQPVEKSMNKLGRSFLSEVDAIMDDLADDQIDAREIDAHLTTLQTLGAVIKQAEIDLLHRKSQLVKP
jgi:hypothetical protein